MLISNYIKVAFRSIVRNKVFAAINLFGLAVGLTVSALIYLHVDDELKYNRLYPEVETLYRVMEHQTYSDGYILTTTATPGLLAEALVQEIPEVSKATRLTWQESR